MSNERRLAGHLLRARICDYFGFTAAMGFLVKDERGIDYKGDERDFTGKNVRTSEVEKLTYDVETNVTTIYTRNSIYYADDNLIELNSGLKDTNSVDGAEDIYKIVSSVEGNIKKWP